MAGRRRGRRMLRELDLHEQVDGDIDWNDSTFVEDPYCESFNAPQWFDFHTLDEHVDDAFFCRPECNHPKNAEDFLPSTSETFPHPSETRSNPETSTNLPPQEAFPKTAKDFLLSSSQKLTHSRRSHPGASKDLSSKEQNEAYEKIVELMCELYRSKQVEFAKERETMEKQHDEAIAVVKKYCYSQHNRWVTRVNELADEIEQMERDVAIKNEEALMYRRKYEDAEVECNDFKALFEELGSCLSESNYEGLSKQQRCKTLVNDVKRLKVENMALRSVSNSEDRYNRLEKKLNDQIMNARAEAEVAQEKINNLSRRLEELHASITEKDTEISRLKTVVAEPQSVFREKNNHISRPCVQPDLHHSDLLEEVSRGCKRKAAETTLEDCKLSKKRATGVAPNSETPAVPRHSLSIAAQETTGVTPSASQLLDLPRRSKRIAAKRAIKENSALETPALPKRSKRKADEPDSPSKFKVPKLRDRTRRG